LSTVAVGKLFHQHMMGSDSEELECPICLIEVNREMPIIHANLEAIDSALTEYKDGLL